MFAMRVVRWCNRKDNQLLLEQYFRLRHEIYIENRRWRDIERPIPMEIDAYDDRHAIYLIGVDSENVVRGGTRLVPTLRPHLLADVFPELAQHRPPRASSILEWTRFFVAPDLRTTGRPSKAAAIVLCGMLEYALLHKVDGISVVCEAFWPARFRKLGWQAEQLGPVLHHQDGDVVALLIDISPTMLALTKAAYDLPLDGRCLETDAATSGRPHSESSLADILEEKPG